MLRADRRFVVSHVGSMVRPPAMIPYLQKQQAGDRMASLHRHRGKRPDARGHQRPRPRGLSRVLCRVRCPPSEPRPRRG